MGEIILPTGVLRNYSGKSMMSLGIPLTYEEVSAFIREVVAIMLQYIVCLLSEARAHISEELHEKFFGQLCESEVNRLCWLA